MTSSRISGAGFRYREDAAAKGQNDPSLPILIEY